MLPIPYYLQSLTKTSFSRAEMRPKGLQSHTPPIPSNDPIMFNIISIVEA